MFVSVYVCAVSLRSFLYRTAFLEFPSKDTNFFFSIYAVGNQAVCSVCLACTFFFI